MNSFLFPELVAASSLRWYLERKDVSPHAELAELNALVAEVNALLAEAEDMDRRVMYTRVTLLDYNASYTKPVSKPAWDNPVAPIRLSLNRSLRIAMNNTTYSDVVRRLPKAITEPAVSEEKSITDSFYRLLQKVRVSVRRLIGWLRLERERLEKDAEQSKRQRRNKAETAALAAAIHRNREEAAAARHFLASIPGN